MGFDELRVKLGGLLFGAPILINSDFYDSSEKKAYLQFKDGTEKVISYKNGLQPNRALMIAGIAISIIGLVIGTMAFTNHIHTFHLSHELAFSMMVSSAVSLFVLPILLGGQAFVHRYLEEEYDAQS